MLTYNRDGVLKFNDRPVNMDGPAAGTVPRPDGDPYVGFVALLNPYLDEDVPKNSSAELFWKEQRECNLKKEKKVRLPCLDKYDNADCSDGTMDCPDVQKSESK